MAPPSKTSDNDTSKKRAGKSSVAKKTPKKSKTKAAKPVKPSPKKSAKTSTKLKKAAPSSAPAKKKHTDIKKGGWIENWLPESLRPFAYIARYDRPIGIWLLFIPALWGMFAVPPVDEISFTQGLRTLVLFAVGAIVMRGAGCTINDWWDSELDKKVERTRSRPLATGDIPSWQALLFLLIQLVLGFMILLQFNGYVIALGFMVLGLIFAYPLMKRFTHWPQLFLGLTFNWGVLMGWMALYPRLSFVPLFLYAAGVFWTLVYDTIYAHQDKEDDMMIGIKSTAILFGDASKKWLRVFQTGMALCLTLAGLIRDVHAIYYFILAGILWLMFTELDKWDLDNPESCLRAFKRHKNYGFGIALAWLVAFIL